MNLFCKASGKIKVPHPPGTRAFFDREAGEKSKGP